MPPREATLTWKYLSPFSLGATLKGKNLLPQMLAIIKGKNLLPLGANSFL